MSKFVKSAFKCALCVTLSVGVGCDDEGKVTPEGGGVSGGGTGGVMTSGVMTSGVMTGGVMTGGVMTGGSSDAGVMSAGEMMGGASSGGVTVAGSDGGAAGGVTGGEVIEGGAQGGEEPEAKGCHMEPDWRPEEQRGVSYVTHYGDEQLVWYRSDLEAPPAEAGRLEMAGPAHDSALDASRHLLAVAHDVQQQVSIYALSAPDASGVPAPALRSSVSTSPYTPRFVLLDPARHQLHVIANAPVDEGLLTEMKLLSYDLSDPGAPTPLSSGELTVPVTTTIALDARAGVLFLVGFTDQTLYRYLLGPEQVRLAEGAPLDLGARYPEMNNTSMVLRSMKVDPIRGRLFIARAQGANSELITFGYPPASATAADAEGCPELLDFERWTRIDDVFDLNVAPAERTNLLNAHSVHPVLGEDLLLFVHDAWVTTASASASMVSAFREGAEGVMSPTVGCDEFEGFGCFLRSYYQQTAGRHMVTEGASCLDQGRKVIAVASVDPNGSDRGEVFFYQQGDDGSMTRQLSAEGSTLAAGLHPVTMECD